MSKNINIIKIIPQGYCKGVVNAIKNINTLLKKNEYKRPLYMLGGLVHNKHVTDAFNELGIITVNDYHGLTCGTLIVTAHGLSYKDKQNIINQGLDLVDQTCTEVLKIQELVKQKVNDGYTVIYYGKLNHAECKAVISTSEKIQLITSLNDIDKLDIKNNKIFFTNQTTMSYFDTLDIIDKLKLKYPNIEVNIDICNASKLRQQAVYNNAKNCNIILIVGDHTSNNTNKLKEIAESFKNCKAYLIENINDIKNVDIKDDDTIGITAGASTPNRLVNEIIKTLEDDNFISNLTNKDYIDFK